MARRFRLSKREAKRLIEDLLKDYPGIPIAGKPVVEVYEDKSIGRIIYVDGIPSFIELNGRLIPHLRLLLAKGYSWLPYVVVDAGAIKPLLNGADVMRPGIRVFHGDFKPGSILAVVEEKYGKPIVVGEALVEKSTAETMSRGRVIRNLHRIGDKYWGLR
jgi:PUA-domain protein